MAGVKRIPPGELMGHIAAGRKTGEIARVYGCDHMTVRRSIKALDHAQLAAAVMKGMSLKTKATSLVGVQAVLEPIDAPATLLKSVAGIQRIQGAFEQYIAKHEAKLTGKKHRGALFVYLETVKTLSKGVQTLANVQAKLVEWAGVEELRKLIVETLEELETLERPIQPGEVKALFLAKFQARIILLRQSVRPITTTGTPEEG